MPQTCSKCVMDESDPEIVFDSSGVCNHCLSYEDRVPASKQPISSIPIFESIDKHNVSSKYNCLAAISGGVDSSYMLHILKETNLKPLVVHIDFGWSTEDAEQNLQNIVKACGFELFRYHVDKEQFKELQLAYLRSGVIDLEIPTDHVLSAALYQTAARHNIRTVLTGQNSATEYFMPNAWVFDKHDARNLLDIYKRFGSGAALTNIPTLSLWKKYYYYNIKKIRFTFLLDHFDYNKAEAEQLLQQKYDWRPYEQKHGEAVWTRFYQCYILPNRFGVDKRFAHLSNLVASGSITREEALVRLSKPIYPYPFEEDKLVVLNKLGITEQELNDFMNLQKRRHDSFRTEKQIKAIYRRIRSKFIKEFLNVSTSYQGK